MPSIFEKAAAFLIRDIGWLSHGSSAFPKEIRSDSHVSAALTSGN